ncbi:MAG: hypothetical protein LBL39_01045, partial [Planctomycetaceae bacterium]|nr:hypothetical protein [Planctomycetaceae bacterium]
MNCNNTTVKTNSVVNANVANDRNCKINFAKASIKRCKFIFCNLSVSLCGLGTLFANLLLGIMAFLRRQALKFTDFAKRQEQHYYILYWLRKRGGIYGGKYLTILCVLLSGAFLSIGGVAANERDWFEDFDGAMYVARTSGKNLLIYLTAEGN